MVTDNTLDFKSVLTTKSGFSCAPLRPLPGQCFAVPTPESEGRVKGIWIPDSAMSRIAPGFVAEVAIENAILEPKSQASIRGTVGRTFAFAKWAGQRFHWQGMDLIRYHLSIEHMLAVYFDGEWVPLQSEGHEMHVMTSGDSVARCRYCKSAGQGNMILNGAGICPQCGRGRSGRIPMRYQYRDKTTGNPIILDEPLRMSPEEREAYGGTGAPKKAKGKIITYKGQK